MKARSVVLVLFVILSLFLVSGCGSKVYREFYGKAIHTYTAPSTPRLEDVPKQFLRDDDTNYVLYFEDAIVASSSYDLSVLNNFFRTKMCSIVTGAGYQCRDMNNNPITGSVFAGVTGASVSKITGNAVATGVATQPIYGCRKNAAGITYYDHYVRNTADCLPQQGQGIIVQRILGAVYQDAQPNTHRLVECLDGARDDSSLAVDQCDVGTEQRTLGYVYTTPEEGSSPLIRCRFNVNNERYSLGGTTQCNPDSTLEQTWYVLPFCTETDGGKVVNVKGSADSLMDADPAREDFCLSDGITVNEFYCDASNYVRGLSDERIICSAGQACVEGRCAVSPALYRIDVKKDHRHFEAEGKISYDIEARNRGPETPNEEGIVVITDLLPAGVTVQAVSPAPSIQAGRTLKWVFDGFGNIDDYRYDSKFDDRIGYTVYRSMGNLRISLNVTVDAGVTGILLNKVNVTVFGLLSTADEDEVEVRAGATPTPTVTPNMVIVGTDTNIPGHGGDVNYIETPYCPRGMRKFSEIFEFHGYNNEVGRKWAFCSRPGVYGQINTCSVEDSSSVNPWTSACEPAACPDGMAAFGGLIKHGYYVRPGLNTYRYINMYSRICLSTDALNAGAVKTCGNQNEDLGETGACDTTQWKDDADGLVCPSGQSPVQGGLVSDPVTSAHDISTGTGAPIWEFRYNNVCADFKAMASSANPPWENGFACTANSDCSSGYCNPSTRVCEVAPVATSENLVIVGTDTNIPGHGGDLNYLPDPSCPFGTSKIGQIFEFHGYNNEWGRKFAFCAKPGITGSIITCDTEDSSSVNPWTTQCDPGACPAGTTALAGLIKHGYYARPGLNTYRYINKYSRVCLSSSAIDSGSVKSCGNQDTARGETGECDAIQWRDDADGLACPVGQTPISSVIGDPVASANHIARGEFRYWEFRYNRLCVDFKDVIPYCGDSVVQLGEQCEMDSNCVSGNVCRNCVCVSSLAPPWANGYSCTANSDCISGYCNPATNTCSAAPGAPTSYRISIPSPTVPSGLSQPNYNLWKTVLVGTCNDNGWVATALGASECTALVPGRALLLLTHNPYRLVIAAGDAMGVGVAVNVLNNGAQYNVHGPRVDIRYSGVTVTNVSFPHCRDGARNFDETGTDCGGSCSACPGAAPTCSDNIRNQGEIGIDCGGPCPACTTYPPATSGGTPSGSSGGGGRRTAATPSESGSAECYDDWICTAWTVCSDSGLQTRTCSLNDYPACTLIIQKPSEQQSCRPSVVSPPVVAVENCFDGLQNQNEEGIDCGGVCAPCPGKASWLVPVIIVLVIAAAALGFLVYYNKFLKKPDVLSPLRKYVKDARGKNVPDSRIRQILQNQGWSQGDIGKVMGK